MPVLPQAWNTTRAGDTTTIAIEGSQLGGSKELLSSTQVPGRVWEASQGDIDIFSTLIPVMIYRSMA